MGTIAKVTAGGETHAIASSAYAYCNTASNTATKVATLSWDDGTNTIPFSLLKGVTVHVKFVNGFSARGSKLQINNTVAKDIKVALTGSNYEIPAGGIVTFTYDGTYWVINQGTENLSFLAGGTTTKLSDITENNGTLPIIGTNGVTISANQGGITVSGPGSSSDTQVTQAAATVSSGEYPIILGYSTTTSAITGSVNKSANLVYNPGTKKLKNTGAFECGSLDNNYGINDEALLKSSTMQLWGELLS